MIHRPVLLAILLLALPSVHLHAEESASLRGSPAGMQLQNRVAQDHGLAFYRTRAEIASAYETGKLLQLQPNDDYDVADFVDHPFLDPAALLFVERLAAQYRAACGQKLVVTSAVRATANQPPNAHALSVHPAGIAVDLRVSDRAACRSWLEDAILGMERRGLIDGIREYHPPHYHIAVFPSQYMAYALERMAAEAESVASIEASEVPEAQEIVFPDLASSLVAEPTVAGRQMGTAGITGLAAAILLLPAIGYLVRRRVI